MGETGDFFYSYGGENAFIQAMADDWDETKFDKESRKRHLRNLLIRKNGGSHSQGEIEELRIRQANCCAYCGIDLLDRGHIDHIMPLSLGGPNSIDNIQITCASCNCTKGAMHPEKLFSDIMLFALNRFRLADDIVLQNEILRRIGVEGMRIALMQQWIREYKRSFAEHANWRANMKRRLKTRRKAVLDRTGSTNR
jgi:5-methylcytosine-specific restriction endonuclease McrA